MTIGKVDRNKVKENANKIKDGKGDFHYPVNLGKLKKVELVEGKNIIDIVHYKITKEGHPDGVKVGSYWYKRPYAIHANLGGDVILCSKGTFGKPCPICDLYRKMYKDTTIDKEVKDRLKSKKMDLYATVDEEGEVKILDVSSSNFGQRLAKEITLEDELQALGDYDTDGRTLVVRMDVEEFMTRKYLVAGRIDYKKREELEDEIIADIPSLDEMFEETPFEELQTIAKQFEAIANEDPEKAWEDDEEEKEEVVEEAPKKRRRAPVEDKKEEPAEEPGEEPEPEEEKVEEAPKKRKRRASKPVEESPAPKAKAKAKPVEEPEPEEDDEEDGESWLEDDF